MPLVEDPDLFIILLHMYYIFGKKDFSKLMCLPPRVICTWTTTWAWAGCSNKKFILPKA